MNKIVIHRLIIFFLLLLILIVMPILIAQAEQDYKSGVQRGVAIAEIYYKIVGKFPSLENEWYEGYRKSDTTTKEQLEQEIKQAIRNGLLK